MKVISFNLNGKMAHFRKYYSNSTALSYILPPVTTIKGMIAGLLGYERDSYYDLFNNTQCKIAISIEKPVKKITQTMNLLKVESLNDLNGAGKNRTQNNTEFLFPRDIRMDWISYKIIFWHSNEDLMNKLEKCLCNDHEFYRSKGISLALGASQCLGWIENGKISKVSVERSKGQEISIHGAIIKDYIEKIIYCNLHSLSISKEETLTEFDKDRFITADSKKELIVAIGDTPLTVILKKDSNYFTINDKSMMFLS